MAWGNFSAMPCPCKLWDEKARKHMLVAFPFVGLLMGIIWYLLFLAVSFFRLPLPVEAVVMTAFPFIVSGAIHLDGFMDCNDAILSRRDLKERQRILKDPHVGSFAVIAILMLFMFSFAFMWAILGEKSPEKMLFLIFIPVLSRALTAREVLKNKPMATSQYQPTVEEGQTKPYILAAIIIWIVAALVAIFTLGYLVYINCYGYSLVGILHILIVVLAQFFALILACLYGRKSLGGMNGDIAGFSLVWSELIALAALAVI